MKIYLLGIAGTGMGSFAGLLRAAGHEVSGSDENVYPPMSDKLAEWRIQTYTPYSEANLDKAKPDLAVVGNVIRAENPEAKAVRRKGVPHMSFPETLEELFLTMRHPVVVAGTHGKTTTTSLLAAVLQHAGRDPSLLVGGVPLNFNEGFRLGNGEHFVIEGDEYDTAYFDKGPKFLHYRARTAILTSIEFDHADIYRDMPHYESAYVRLAESLPMDGTLVVCASYPNAVAIARRANRARVVTYTADEHVAADFAMRDLRFDAAGAHFLVHEPGAEVQMLLPMSGRHNVENALGVYAVARSLGLTSTQIAAGFASFAGVKRRQEPRGEPNGILVIDDFAHHPTAVRETIHAIRLRYPNRRLWAVFEPRSNTSRRNIHQREYAESFDGAQLVSLKVPEPHDKVPANEQLDVPAVAESLREHGIDGDYSSEVGELVQRVATGARRGDVVLVMSNGAFGGFIPSLLGALESRRD